MRESNYTFPPSNRAVISINQMLYDRRALDTNSTLALLNNLCQLTYLTSTSPRIREVLTMDGGLERMLDILRDSALPREPTMPDLWGLNGPSTARTINVDRAISLRHSLAFQSVVNIGVRGNENIRTRVVQAGALDIVAQILESWLKKNNVAIFSSTLGSQAAVDALAAGVPLPGVARHRKQGQSRHQNNRDQTQQEHHSQRQQEQPTEQQQQRGATNADRRQPLQPDRVQRIEAALAQLISAEATPPTAPAGQHPAAQPAGMPHSAPAVPTAPSHSIPGSPAPRTAAPAAQPPRGLGHLVASITNRLQNRNGTAHSARPVVVPASGVDTDVEMADAETEGGETDANDTDAGGDASMDVEYLGDADGAEAGPGQATTTPRARLPLLPLQIPRHSPEPVSAQPSTAASSATGSASGDEPNPIPRARSDVSLNLTNQPTIAPGRPRSGLAARIPHVTAAPDAASTQSSPVGSPVHVEHIEATRGRRGTVVGRPLLLASRDNQRRQEESEASDGALEPDLAQATITAGIAAAAANAAMEAAAAVGNQPHGAPGAPQPAIVEENTPGMAPEEPDPEVLAAEQARFDMEAGAPPGQPGATPQVATTDVPLAQNVVTDPTVPGPAAPATQIIIANGAPRGFQDLASYVGVSMLLNPEGTNYSEDNILLALQLLAYLSKYPHVRAAFHHPRRPMHRTFELGPQPQPEDEDMEAPEVPLPQRPPASETPNIFSLVERFTFRPSPSDPHMYRIPSEIQYWAGVIMRNACRKDDTQNGIRQCAYMSCGRWEVYPREFAKCRRCRKAKYCSKECQSKAWSEGHRFWCSIRSEPEPNAGGGGGGPGGGGGSGGGGGGRRETRRREDDDDVDMGGGQDERGGRAGGGVDATPRAAPRATRQMDGNAAAPTDAPGGQAAPIAANDGDATPRARSPVPRGATMPLPRRAAASTSSPPLPPTSTPPPAPTLTPATPRLPVSATASRPAPPSLPNLPDFLKRGGEPGPSSTSAMNAAMGRF